MTIIGVSHTVTICLWCLLVPLTIRMIQVAPSSSRLAIALGLSRFLFLTFLLFYTWGSTQGTNEILINLLARLYIAADATISILVMEHWHALARSTTGTGNNKRVDRKNHLIFTLSLLFVYWSWLIYGFTQLHLR
jgi:hypothetical protein